MNHVFATATKRFGQVNILVIDSDVAGHVARDSCFAHFHGFYRRRQDARLLNRVPAPGGAVGADWSRLVGVGLQIESNGSRFDSVG